MTSGRGWRGCPPGTTLSRNRRGHSSPPRDGGLALRRISPEDTGPGRAPPPTPPSPLWHGSQDPRRRLIHAFGPTLSIDSAWADQARGWTKGNGNGDGAGAMLPLFTGRRGGWGRGAASAEPYLLGSFFEARNQDLEAGQSGPAGCGSACSAEAAPRPRPPVDHLKLVRPRGGLAEEGGEDEGDHGHQLDENVHAGPGGVLEGVADGVAHHRGLVGLGSLAA